MEDRPQHYPSDTSDEQWAIIEPLLPSARTGGRPEKHPRRLRDVPTQPSGRCDETGSAALSTNTWRSHEVTRLSAPTPGARPSAARRC